MPILSHFPSNSAHLEQLSFNVLSTNKYLFRLLQKIHEKLREIKIPPYFNKDNQKKNSWNWTLLDCVNTYKNFRRLTWKYFVKTTLGAMQEFIWIAYPSTEIFHQFKLSLVIMRKCLYAINQFHGKCNITLWIYGKTRVNCQNCFSEINSELEKLISRNFRENEASLIP